MDDPTVGATASAGAAGATPALPYQDFHVRDAEIRVFDRSDEPDSDDANDMYVIEVFGVSVLIRLRTPHGDEPDVYVHIDNEGRRPVDLAVEVDNRGETRYRL
jgi:hypothetical protein